MNQQSPPEKAVSNIQMTPHTRAYVWYVHKAFTYSDCYILAIETSKLLNKSEVTHIQNSHQLHLYKDLELQMLTRYSY
jgi:hypothetical protein